MKISNIARTVQYHVILRHVYPKIVYTVVGWHKMYPKENTSAS